MPRPSFQFYPADWRTNAKLRRCSPAARGAWMDILCVFHDSDEYGMCRWPLAEVANSAGVRLKLAQELVQKNVLKGADQDHPGFVWQPFHAGKLGEKITLAENTNRGPLWFSSRMIKDEYIRLNRGKTTQFTSDNQPPKATPSRRVGERQGDGSSSSSSSSSPSTKEVVKTDSSDRPADEPSRSARADKAEHPRFQEFYEKYPRREGRRTALKAFTTATKRAPVETILAGSARYALAMTGTERRFVKLPATWLNGDHWNDEIPPNGAQNGRTHSSNNANASKLSFGQIISRAAMARIEKGLPGYTRSEPGGDAAGQITDDDRSSAFDLEPTPDKG